MNRLKGILICLILFLKVLNCYTQDKIDCNVKQVKCFNLLNNKNQNLKKGTLESKLFYRIDGQLLKVELFNIDGYLTGTKYYEYDSLNRCVLSFFYDKKNYTDSLYAKVDAVGNLIPIRQVTFRNGGLLNSKFIKIKLNECSEPSEIKIYNEGIKWRKFIVSKYKYEYVYW